MRGRRFGVAAVGGGQVGAVALRGRQVGVVAGGLAFGLGSEWAGYGWQSPADWGPDLAAGLVWFVCAAVSWPLDRRTAVLSAAVGAAWFLGGYLPVATYWHRGVVVHLLVTYPGWRPGSRPAWLAVATGYATAVFYSAWRDDITGALLALGLCALLVWLRAGAVGERRRHRATAVYAGGVLCLVLAAGSLARQAVPMQEAVRPALLAFEAALCVTALVLTAGLRPPVSGAVTDLVVELGETRWGALRGGLARLLGDPGLRIGYWVTAAEGYVDERGRPVRIPSAGTGRQATRLDRDGDPLHFPATPWPCWPSGTRWSPWWR